MSPMVRTTCCTTSPPRPATWLALAASALACWAFSAFCWTVAISCSIAAEVSSSALACDSVRIDRSLLPEAISPEAVRTVSDAARICSSTAAILSAKRLKALAICVSSSRPEASMRRVRSPSPEAMSSSASRTSSMRRSWRLTNTDIRPPAASRHSTVIMTVMRSIDLNVAVARSRSTAVSSIHGVPSTLAAYTICAAPSIVSSACSPPWTRRASSAASSPAARSVSGLSVNSLRACARMVLLVPSTSTAKLFSVGWMALTFLTTEVSFASALTTPASGPPACVNTGSTKLTYSSPVLASAYAGVMAGPPVDAASLYQGRAVPSKSGGTVQPL